MTAPRRWALVALVTAVLVAAPLAWRLVPAQESDLDATELYALVDDAADRPYTGYVETEGTLALPVADRFRSVGDLFGESTRLRVWWRDSTRWRVSQLHATGETALAHVGDVTTEYDYEEATSTTSYDPQIRLPRAADLLPPEVARRLLGGDDPDAVSRLPARRVAGISAAGLRVEGDDGRSSIGHVDLWADPETGLPLRVEVYARGAATPGFTTVFVDYSTDEPTGDEVTFRGTESTRRTFDDVLDIADAANQFAPFSPPDRIAGLSRSTATDGAVGVYGDGLTQVLAIPVRDREADPMREQIRGTPGAVDLAAGTAVAVGPLGVLLSGSDGDRGWLVAGTVTQEVLDQAAADLLAGTVSRDNTVFGGCPVIRTAGLTKRFGRITAVDGVDLDVREGDVYGFLGANGSGKTTTVRMLLGLVLATSGTVDLLGQRMPGAGREVLPDVGAIIEDPAAYPHLSGRANLALFDAMDHSGPRASRAGRVDDALDRVGLGDVDGRPVRAYSLGMRQRLGLAHALMGSPRLLVLDEPTNGLDPQGIRDVRALLLELNRNGTTVFVSSHLLAEIEQMCTRVGVLHQGRLVLQDHLDDLQRATGRVLVVTSHADRAAERLGTRLEERDGDRLLVRTDDVADLAAELVTAGIPVDELTPERRSLEQIVLEATRAADQPSEESATEPAGETR